MIVLCRQPPPLTSPPPPILPQSSTCRLLALPAEIRTAIWELVLIQPHPEEDDEDSFSSSPKLREECKRAAPQPRPEDRLASPTPITTAPSRFCANILRTCRQCHAEGEPILYGGNAFLAHPTLLAALPSLLLRTRSGPRRAAPTLSASAPTPVAAGGGGKQLLGPVTSARLVGLVRRFHVRVRLDADARFTRQDCGAAFAGAELLVVEAWRASYGTGDLAVLALFEGVRGVRRARVWGSVGDGRYARWLEGRMMGKGTGEGEEEGKGGERERCDYGAQSRGDGVPWDVWTHGNR